MIKYGLGVDLYDRLFNYLSVNKSPIIPSVFSNNTFIVNDKIFTVFRESPAWKHKIISIDNSWNIKDDYQKQSNFYWKLWNLLFFGDYYNWSTILDMNNSTLSKVWNYSQFSDPKIIWNNAFIIWTWDNVNELIIFDIDWNKKIYSDYDFKTSNVYVIWILNWFLYYNDATNYNNRKLKKLNLTTNEITLVWTNLLDNYWYSNFIFNNNLYFNDESSYKLKYIDYNWILNTVSSQNGLRLVYSNWSTVLVFDEELKKIYKLNLDNTLTLVLDNTQYKPRYNLLMNFNNKFYAYYSNSWNDYFTIDLTTLWINIVNWKKIFIINENKLYEILSPTSLEETSIDGTKKIRKDLNIIEESWIAS